MKKPVAATLFAAAAAAAFAADGELGTVKVAWFDKVISPEVGIEICGYEPHRVSVEKQSDLHAVGCAVDDGERRTLIISCDLLGIEGEYLAKILPDAGCYGDAMALYKEIKGKVLDDWKFEMKIYQDGVDLEKQRIEAARAIGVAYGEHQPNKEVNIDFIRGY